MIPPTKETKKKKNRGASKKKQKQSVALSAAQQVTTTVSQQNTPSNVGSARSNDSSYRDAFNLNSFPMLDYLSPGVSRHEQTRNPPAGRVSQSLVDTNSMYHQSSIFNDAFAMETFSRINEFPMDASHQQQQGIPLLQYRQPTQEDQESTANQIPFNMSRHNPDDQQQLAGYRRHEGSRFDIMDYLHENSVMEDEEIDGNSFDTGHYRSTNNQNNRNNLHNPHVYNQQQSGYNPTANHSTHDSDLNSAGANPNPHQYSRNPISSYSAYGQNINLNGDRSSFPNGTSSSNPNGSNAGFRRGESFTSSLQAQMHRNPLGDDGNNMNRFVDVSSFSHAQPLGACQPVTSECSERHRMMFHGQPLRYQMMFDVQASYGSFTGTSHPVVQPNNFGVVGAAVDMYQEHRNEQHEGADIIGAVAQVREAVVADHYEQDQEEQQDAVVEEDDENEDGLHQGNYVNQEQVQQDNKPNDEQNTKKPDEKEERRYPRRDNILRIDYYEPDIPDDDEFLCESMYSF